MTNRVLHHPITHLLLIVTVGALAYANIFRVPFVYDDLESIVRNPVIQDLRNFAPGGPGYAYTPRRWFGYFTFALNYRLGGFHVAGYHLLNLCIHLGVALLVYSFVCLCFRTPHCRNSPLAPWARAIALLAALLFVAHPVQTQAVTYTVQRLTSLSTFLYLLATVLYIRARLAQEYPTGLQAAPPQNRTGPAWFAAVCRYRGAWGIAGATVAALLAMQTKEIAFTLPLAVLVFEASFLGGPWRKRIPALLPLLLTLPLIPLGIWWSGAAPSPTADLVLEDPFRAHTDISRLDYLLTQFRVLATYLRLLVLPLGQNVDYDYPRFSSFFTPQVFFSCLLLVSLLLWAGLLFRSSSRRAQRVAPEWRLIAFGIVWFFLTLSVESSLVPIGDLISEHRLYLPSLGVAVAVATAVGILARTARSAALRRTVLLLAGLAVVGLATATWQRNRVWASPLLLWQDTVRKSPGKARPWYNLGTYEMEVQRLDAAIRALERAVGIDPEHAEAWHNLGLAHLMAGRYEQALVPLRRAVRLEPGLADAEVNLAIALIYTGRTAASIPHLERVRDQAPTRSDVRYNLGIAYAGVGRLPEAEGELSALRELAPKLADALAGELRRTYRPQVESPSPAGAATGE